MRLPSGPRARAEAVLDSVTRKLERWRDIELPQAEDRVTKAKEWRKLRIDREKAALKQLLERHATKRAIFEKEEANARQRIKREEAAADRKLQLAQNWHDDVTARIAELESMAADALIDVHATAPDIDEP
jgi:uncharacterized protein YdaU (DUF1376 family)